MQLKAEELIRQTAAILTKLFDVTATKDWTNCVACADVVLDGTTLLTQVPITYLLFLEKQLVDMHTFIKKLPMLDASESWAFDPSADAWATEPVQTAKTKKIPRNHVKAEATDKHPFAWRDALVPDVDIPRRAAVLGGDQGAVAVRHPAVARVEEAAARDRLVPAWVIAR